MAEKPKQGGIAHMELITNDPNATKKFYESVFGWKFNFIKEMDYWMYETPAGEGGGIRKPDANEVPGTFPYVRATSLKDIANAIEKAGGKVLVPRQEVPGFGAMIVFQAPGGVVQGAWEAAPGQ